MRSPLILVFGMAVMVMAAWVNPALAVSPPEGWASGVGNSSKTDPREAGEEAALEAFTKLDGTPAKVVVVGAAAGQVTPDLIEGVRKYFGKDIIYGCQITSPLTAATNFPDAATIDVPAGVAVWALGGTVDVRVESVRTDPEADDSYFDAGFALGSALRDVAAGSKRPGKIIVTFGDQYNGVNKDFAFGMNEGLEDVYPIVGAAAGNIDSRVIIQGEVVTGVNVGIFIGGEFILGQSYNGGTHTPETADRTLREAVSEVEGEDPFFALIFNCRRRRQGMIERQQLGEELEAIRRRLPGVDFFGFYGPGEIGSRASGEPAEGVGFTVVAAVFFPLPGDSE